MTEITWDELSENARAMLSELADNWVARSEIVEDYPITFDANSALTELYLVHCAERVWDYDTTAYNYRRTPAGRALVEAQATDDSRTQSLLEQRNSLLNDEVKIHALLARVDWSIDEDVVTCVAGLVDEVAKLRAERDALKAAARAWKQAAKLWRSDYNDLMADFTELTEAFEEAGEDA